MTLPKLKAEAGCKGEGKAKVKNKDKEEYVKFMLDKQGELD